MTQVWYARLALAAASGLALALAFPTYNYALLAWVALALLLVAVAGARPGQAALWGFLHGAVFATLTLAWIYTVMRVHGGVLPLPAGAILALVVAVLSLFPAAFAFIVAWVGRRNWSQAFAVAPFAWVALEYARTHLPTFGFPWNLLGYAASGNLALVQLVSLTGIWGLSFLVAFYNALLARAVMERAGRRRGKAWIAWLGVTAALVLAASVGERIVPQDEPQHTARLVQTNFPELPSYPADWMEQHAAELDELERLSSATRPQPVNLVVWPEVPAPFTLQDPGFAARAERIAVTSGHPLLVGVVDWKLGPDGSFLPYNSAALLDPGGRLVFLYDKIHLVPFGEYVPLRRWLTFAKKVTAQVGDFQPGAVPKVAALPEGGKFGVFICYESIFPAEVRRFVGSGADLLVNISNDGWFLGTAAPAQHLMMARVRAVENRRWLLRATNTGYSVSVDPYGRYAARLAPDIRAALEAPYGFRSDTTLYARLGSWVPWASVAVVAVGLASAGARRKQ